MVNFLRHLENPQVNYEKIYEVMRDFRKGGLNPENYNSFLATIATLPKIRERTYLSYQIFDKYNLVDITEDDSMVIMKEVLRRAVEDSKFCWHPQANSTYCKVDREGKIIVSAAHSIQNNGILSTICENHEVATYKFEPGRIDKKVVKKKVASIFWGFCNTHDAIFKPIENFPYTGTQEQNFLFAYRAFVVASHKKMEVSTFMNFGGQAYDDIARNRELFDNALINNDYSKIVSEVFELPFFYPIACSSSFYLDFDFEGNMIPHSEERMENVFITLLPAKSQNKSYFIFSYFTEDSNLYEKVSNQLKTRNNLKLDISILIGAHAENVYFEPIYYDTFIKDTEEDIYALLFETQMDHGFVNNKNEIVHGFSYTPSEYLQNRYNLNLFGY